MHFRCNICGGTEIGQRKARGDGKQVLFCAGCGMGVIEDLPASTDVFYADGYYGREAGENPGYIDYAFTAEHGLLWVQLMIQALRPNGGCILDVGCADGFLLHRLQGDYRRFGIEVNVAAQAQARARGVTILGSDIMEPGIAAAAGPFDVITSIATFEHVLDFRGAVSVCLSQLAPEGILLFEVPLISATRDNKDWYHGSYEHIYYPTVSGLERLFGSFEGLQFHGFESDIKGFSSSYIGAASFHPEAFARTRRLLEAMHQPNLGGLDDTGTRLNLAYHVVHSFRPNAERVQALPTLLEVAHAPNLLKRLTQLWHEDVVLADAWRRTETMLHAGTEALGIAQESLDRLRQELERRQKQFEGQQQALAAEQAAFAELRAQCHAAQQAQAEHLAEREKRLVEGGELLAARNGQLAKREATLAARDECLAKREAALATQMALLEHRMAVYRPLLRLRRIALGALGRRA